jgi:hypothetical protein
VRRAPRHGDLRHQRRHRRQGARVEGEATVYLLPPAPELAPIAVDDTVVVRAGSQIDIPCSTTTSRPAGGARRSIPPRSSSSTPDALAFAGGDVLRYLAPTEPGEYTIDYAVYTTGRPSLADTATVRVQVLPTTRTAPRRRDARGPRAERPVDARRVRRVRHGPGRRRGEPGPDRQPARERLGDDLAGRESIVYSSVPATGSGVFRYRVVDAFGETARDVVRIGVLDEQSNPSPITFTDYVQVQAGRTARSGQPARQRRRPDDGHAHA